MSTAYRVGDRVVPYLTGGISTVDAILPAVGQAHRSRSGASNSDRALMLDKIELYARIIIHKLSFEPTYLAARLSRSLSLLQMCV